MKNETSYFPGCHLSSAGKRNPHQVCEHLRETLEARKTCENIHKELDRRESRNEKLMKELQSVRSSLNDTQNELRILKGVFDKTKYENRMLSSELGESKEYGYKLELQVSRLDDACKLLSDLQGARSEIKKLHLDIGQKKLEMSVTEEKISAQQREIETLNRSLDACVFYQGSRKSSVEGGGAPSAEKMRTIYYELGKRQSDIRAISLSLSQAQSDLAAVTSENTELQDRVATLDNIISGLRKTNETYLEKTSADADAIAKLSDENACADNDIKRLSREVEELSAKLETQKLEHSDYAKQKESQVEVLSDDIFQLQDENQKLSDRVESLQLSLRQKDSLHVLGEQRLRSEIHRLDEEKKLLQNYLREGSNSTEQMEKLRRNLSEALATNDALEREGRESASAHRHAMEMLQETADRAESNLSAVRKELTALRREYDVVLAEREEAAGALRRAIEMAKGLSAKVAEEQNLREEAEIRLATGQKRMQDILRAKEQVSYAVLDALHKERALQSSVNRTLSEMRKREEGEEMRASPLHLSKDSLNMSLQSDKGPEHQLEPTLANTVTPKAGAEIPPEEAATPNETITSKSPRGQATGEGTEGAAVSASTTPHPRPPLPESSSISPLIHMYAGAASGGEKRSGPSQTRNALPPSPEHLDIGHRPSARNHLIGDLKRLRQEVAVLDSKSKEITADRGRDNSPESAATGHIHDEYRSPTSTPLTLTPDRQRPFAHDELSETHRYTSSPLYMREIREPLTAHEKPYRQRDSSPPQSSPANRKSDLVEHSLFDILNMDPRVDFASSPAR